MIIMVVVDDDGDYGWWWVMITMMMDDDGWWWWMSMDDDDDFRLTDANQSSETLLDNHLASYLVTREWGTYQLISCYLIDLPIPFKKYSF